MPWPRSGSCASSWEFDVACTGLIAGKPAPTGSPQPWALCGPVGAGLPAIGPKQVYSAICNLRAWVYTYRTFSYSNGEFSWP
ncbi:hypothetical protein FCH83_26120 [Pseudomonas putida]|nr:hypothetical protein [Pseudomonas putida]NTZ00446.1 hypothetical protein [Pseudomonas putida]NTZ26089.1 hypothetical protein [Pseudomonas putida]NTZ58364.1 hypothetical protein [Pseudomonas putida]NTZ69639.1 hypothetical protein [Pseudomonas putida]